MSEYVLAPAANAELEEAKAIARRMVGSHVVTAAQASAWYWEQVKKVIRQGAMIEGRADQLVFVQCARCDRVEKIARDVLRYSCKCSPHVEQYAFKNRTIVL